MKTLFQCRKCCREEWADSPKEIVCCGEKMQAVGGIVDRPILVII